MNRRVSTILIPVLLLLGAAGFSGSADAQYFGKNKVNYMPFSWEYIQTENFDIYFTEGGYDIALMASELAEDAYASISAKWGYNPRNRVPLIVYNSHNDFSQTNVILEPIEEGVGGFTEMFKNRVVVPWEGSFDKFRHVIQHELTHAMYFDMLYGGILDSIMGREYMFQLPLWFAEGLAEHQSQYWSTEADMIIRDAIITGYLPQIQNIYGGYLVYKGGESFFKYLQEEYGGPDRWVAGEVLNSLRMTKDIDKTYKAVFGKSMEDLSKEWQRRLKSDHWPEVAGREIPEDFALKLTDHTKLENYINTTPVFNPTGDRIAFLTDRNGYREIMVMSAIDGKIIETVVRGEEAGDYEEMHWLRGGITWSPDGKNIAFAAKAGKHDAIHIRKIEDGGYNKIITPDMDAIYSPDWSPDGTCILFCGIKNGKLDLYTVNVGTLEYTQLTNDYFDEAQPRWSPDGTRIAFASDRLDPPYKLRIADMNGNYDLFVMDADGDNIIRIASSPQDDRNPDWSADGGNLVFISDRNGIMNLYSVHLADNTVKPLTNLLTGASMPSWSPDDTKIAFSAFKEGGWDVYILKRPLKRDITAADLIPTAYRNETLGIVPETPRRPVTVSADDDEERPVQEKPSVVAPAAGYAENAASDIPAVAATDSAMTHADDTAVVVADTTAAKPDMSAPAANAASAPSIAPRGLGLFSKRGETVIVMDDSGGQKLAVADMPAKKYKLRFSPDMFNAFASYNTFYGIGGMGQLTMSDIMGNHRIALAGNLMYSIEESDLFFTYLNLRRQTNYGFSLFNYKNYYRSYNWNIYSDRVVGGSLLLSRPFSKFTRTDLALNYLQLDRNAYSINSFYNDYYYPIIVQKHPIENVRTFTVSTELVNDTTLWGYTGPATGKRYRINFEYSPPLEITDISFTTFEADYRKYHHFSGNYTFMARLSGGASYGADPRMFFLGGTDNWINARIAKTPEGMETLQDIFFARYPFPLRGFRYYEEYGRRYFLTNFEFRYPFIDYLSFRWPLPLVLGNISGALFTDIGAAWDRPMVDANGGIVRTTTGDVVYDHSFHGGEVSNGNFRLDDIKMSIGFGIRINLGFAVTRFDTSWRTDLDQIDNKPMFNFSLGPEF